MPCFLPALISTPELYGYALESTRCTYSVNKFCSKWNMKSYTTSPTFLHKYVGTYLFIHIFNSYFKAVQEDDLYEDDGYQVMAY